MKKIVVTGANGQLGNEIKAISHLYKQYDFIFTDKEILPLDNFNKIEIFFKEAQPDYFINCAAYTAVDKAEIEKEIANNINNVAVGIIADCCVKYECKLIQISTDYVFDGRSPVSLDEGAITRPISIYGKTKLDGELVCLKNNPDSIIIRTSWVYSEFGTNFVKTMMRLMGERETIGVVNDQIGSPTYAADLAKVIVHIIQSEHWISGIYNFSNQGEISWFDFAKDIKKLIGSNCDVKGIPTSSYPTPAKRPSYSLLDKSKIMKIYNIEVPFYKDSLAICVKKILIN